MQQPKVGDTVEIFQKPFTREDSEGKAEIKRIRDVDKIDHYLIADVQFENDEP